MKHYSDKTPARYQNPSRYHGGVKNRMRAAGKMHPLELYSPDDALKAAGLL